MNKLYTIALILLIQVNLFAQQKASIEIDAGKELGQLRRSELYNNNSLLRTPSNAIMDKIVNEIGVAEIMRCWVTIDDYWNPETDQYNFNFPCGWDLNKWDTFYGYMDRFSRTSKEILLNVRGHHEKVKRGEISMAKWRAACKNGIAHYKKLYPKIKYIEALNEYEVGNFGDISDDLYYEFYQEFYKMINEINQELQPAIPLQIGGPCNTHGSIIDGKKRETMRAFLQNFSNDKNPNKKLDFISYHDYGSAQNPSLFAQHESLIDGWCKEFGLSTSLPLLLNEMGDNTRSRYNNTLIKHNQLIQATCMASLFYHLQDQPDIRGFHWVIQHKNQDRKNQIYDNLRWSPYGMSLKMAAAMEDTRVAVKGEEIEGGRGAYCVATKSEDKVTLLLWNYQWEDGESTYDVDVKLKNLPGGLSGKSLKVKEYLLDLKHNNIQTHYPLLGNSDPTAEQLTVTNEADLPQKGDGYSVKLEPNAMCLLEITAK